MLKKLKGIIASVFSLVILTACGVQTSAPQAQQNGGQGTGEQQVQLTVSAAASLKDALNEIKAAYQKEHPNVVLSYNFGSSGTLIQQIEQGAASDLFFSAGASQMNELEQKGLLHAGTRVDLLKNKLVVVVPANAPFTIHSFADVAQAPAVKKVAMGNPATTPAGKYAKDYYQAKGLWPELSPKLVLANDVRQVLSFVETGNVDAGFVYITDAKLSKKVKVVAEADPEVNKRIVYPAAVLKDTQHTAEAKQFLQYLQGEEAKKVFEKYGFVLK